MHISSISTARLLLEFQPGVSKPNQASFGGKVTQGLAATLIPAYVCAQATAKFGLGFGLAAILLIGLAFLSAGACWFVYRALARLFAAGSSAA